VFKFVAGVLNGAYHKEKLSECEIDVRLLFADAPQVLRFEDACDALAQAVSGGHVPPRGLAVLVSLLQSSPPILPLGSRLHRAVGIGSAEKEPQPAAKVEPQPKEPALEADDENTSTGAPGSVEGEDGEGEDAEAEGREGEIEERETQGSTETKPCPSIPNMLFRYVTSQVRGINPSTPLTVEGVSSFDSACDALAECVTKGVVPRQGVEVLIDCLIDSHQSEYTISRGTQLADALSVFLCPCGNSRPRAEVCDTCDGSSQVSCARCGGSGRFAPTCRGCDGTGKGRTRMYCPSCAGSGKKDLGSCRSCDGKKRLPCKDCVPTARGTSRPCCKLCVEGRRQQETLAQSQPDRRGSQKKSREPRKGMSVTSCSASELTRLQDLWISRRGRGEVMAAWKVDNDWLTYKFKQRLEQLRGLLGREPDVLEGFHGTSPENVLSICDGGFDKGRRAGQVYGAGEYFAKNPTVSISYARGGRYMLVCRLSLGVQSSTPENKDGDHIWVPSTEYYVIKEPSQVLPQFIVRFTSPQAYDRASVSETLEAALAVGYSTKVAEEIVPVPHQQRPCNMSREAATVLWLGFLHAHLSDESLREDVTRFLTRHAGEYMAGAKVQIVKGHYKKAHAILRTPIPRTLVHSLNTAPFFEDGVQRTICVEDAHGSPGQRCPRFIAGFCRGQNLRFTHPCFCAHERRATDGAHFSLEPLEADGAKWAEIADRFMASAPFHTGQPRILGISVIRNKALSRCHEEYRDYLRTKHMEEPAVQELYHGTNNNILNILYQHGLQPPSDTEASDACPVSGGKGLCTTLCDNTCRYCTRRHEWNRCHMYGLGIYLADMAQKSHRYVSQPAARGGRQIYRMVVCSVLGKSFQVEGHLKEGAAMHDVVNVRSLDEEELDSMVAPCKACSRTAGVGASVVGTDGSVWGRVVADEGNVWRLHTGRIAKKETEGYYWNWCRAEELSADNREGSAEKSDLLFVKGLGSNAHPGFSVVNSEYIAFHPHQCLPKYEIQYEIDI